MQKLATQNGRPDVAYLDPMYPERRKTAAVKKEMAYFHDLVGAAQDEAELLDASLNTAKKRIVVKRRAWANFLTGANCLSIHRQKQRGLTFTFRQGRLKTRSKTCNISKETADVISAAAKCAINTFSQTSLEQTIMELVFIRHGQSEWNAKNLFTGWRRRQAEASKVWQKPRQQVKS